MKVICKVRNQDGKSIFVEKNGFTLLDDKSLCVVHNTDWKCWDIIDIDSGLKVISAKTRKLLLQNWTAKKCELQEAIDEARKADYYKKAVKELEDYLS